VPGLGDCEHSVGIQEYLADAVTATEQAGKKSGSGREAEFGARRILDEQTVDHVKTLPESRARLDTRSKAARITVLTRLLALIIALCTLQPLAASGNIALPDMGASADRLLSPEEESRYGESLLRELRRQNLIIEDPLVADYLRALGYRLVAYSERQADDFTFFVVRSDEINAFAAPGGYVGVNVGLIYAFESESELAAVLAHEIAHVSQRHLVRAWESMQKATLPIALAMIGAVIAAQGASGDGTEAALISGMGLLQQQSINFTRNNEYEADRIGIHTLHNSGFDPGAMATTFARMGRAMRANGRERPEFLRTHPVTLSRVTEAKDRAAAIERDQLRPAALERPDEARFHLMRERAHVLTAIAPADLIGEYQKKLDTAEASLQPSLRYGLALAQLYGAQPRPALAALKVMAAERPNEPLFELPLAEALSANDDSAEALTRLERLAKNFPGNRAVQLGYANELVRTGDSERGALASAVLRDLLVRHGDDPSVQQSYARASELAGQELRALEAHAEVALLNGRPLDAMEQLRRLLERPKLDYYQRARVEARIQAITPWVLEVERLRNRSQRPS
jgi:beta-barrel assembly-enhancing protease